MENHSKIKTMLIILAVVLILVIGIYFYERRNFPIKLGSQGEEVIKLQKAIIDKYGTSALPNFHDDGKFGDETLAAVRKYLHTDEVDYTMYKNLKALL